MLNVFRICMFYRAVAFNHDQLFCVSYVLTFHILSAELGGVLEAMGVKTSKQKLAKMIKEVDTGG